MKYILLLILAPFILNAQEIITADKFIQKAVANSVVSISNQDGEINIPWIEGYDFRSDTRDFNFNKQQYTFRISPNSPAKIKAQKELANILIKAPDFDQQEYMCDRFKSAHQDWLKLYIIEQKIAIMDGKSSILDDKSKVQSKLKSVYDYNYNDIIGLEKEISDHQFEVKKLLIEKEGIRTKHYSSNVSFDFSDIIEISDVHSTLQADLKNTIEEKEHDYKLEIIKKEIELEEAEGKQLIDFAQFRYQGPHDDIIQERLSLGIGLSLSRSGNRVLKIKELELELEQNENEKARDESNYLSEVASLKHQLQMKILHLLQFEEIRKKERQKLLKISENVSQKSGFDPMIILEIEERNTDSRLEEIKMKEEIFEDYIDYLDITHSFCDGKNNLSTY